MSTSRIQERWQAYGPFRPSVAQLAALLRFMPSYFEVQAIAIRGQGGGVVIECRHDDSDIVYAFEQDGENLVPSTIERINA